MKFVGFHDKATLPVKAGDIVTIMKGVTVRTIGPGGYWSEVDQ